MKNINIPAYYYFENSNPKVTYEDGSEVIHKDGNEAINEISNEIVVILNDNLGKKLIFKARTITFDKVIYIAPFPNPVHLLIFSSIENYNQSVNVIKQFAHGNNIEGENITVLEINENNTSHKYNDYVRLRILSIITLVNSIEAFLNQIIPNEFKYKVEENGNVKELDKKSIESTKVSFRDKLTKLIYQFKNIDRFETDNAPFVDSILDAYSVRKEIVHMKTNSENELELYFKTVSNILEIDIEKVIEDTISYINNISPEFISLENQ